MNGRTPERSDAAHAELRALVEVYTRHTPDLDRVPGDHETLLATAARAHRVLADRRSAGEQLIRVRPPHVDPDDDTAGGRAPAAVVEIVADDMPFLVDAVLGSLRRLGAEPQRVIHPIVVVRRDGAGVLTEVLAAADPATPPGDAVVESWIHVDLEEAPADPGAVEQDVAEALEGVREIVEDTPAMVAAAADLARRVPDAGVAAMLRWLADGHLTFLGHRRYRAVDGELRAVPGSGLGVLRRAPAEAFAVHGDDGTAEPLVLTRVRVPGPLTPAHPYYVAVRTFDASGRLTGEHRFLGMLTVPALYESVLDIPLVAQRVRGAIRRAGFPLESYSGQRMLDVISGLPREELFGATEADLHDTALGVLAVAGRRAVRLFVRADPYRRFLSCLVYLPRDRYTTSSRMAMAAVLERRLGGRRVDFTVRVTESDLAQVHFTVHTDPQAPTPDVDRAALEDELTEAVRTWDDRLLSAPGGDEVAALLAGVPDEYKAVVGPARAVEDLRRVAALREPGDFGVRLHPEPDETSRAHFRCTLHLAGEPVTLTAVLPLLQHLGVDVLDERPAEIVRPDGLRCWLYDFGLRPDDATRAAIADRPAAEVAAGFCAAFTAALRGDVESDRFSALVLRAGLPWREVAVLRAYARYARQLGPTYGSQYIADTLLAHPRV
ncbi:MAG TPA: NAD-glutamate dehydrogenase, partial [Pseudonocardia sp.]|nr:NAD-glutamate dehydrogenase [Pseudonocardia sp.]